MMRWRSQYPFLPENSSLSEKPGQGDAVPTRSPCGSLLVAPG
jgi:hypothetical protein